MKTFASIVHRIARPAFRRFVCLFGLLLLPASIPAAAHAATPVDGYKVVAKYPHSTESYTEGFFYLNGIFYEGTGLTGHSQLLAIDPQTGRATQHHDVPAQYFGEGIVDWDRTSWSGPGSRTSASSSTASACRWSGSSPTPVRAGA
jgi:glutamine cyclotransferase